MRALALTALVLTAPLAHADTEAALRQRCAEQERQISALETEIESLHSKLALERRRARGSEAPDVEKAPAAQPVTTAYQVRNGDTLSSIARRNGTTAAKLMQLNDIKDPTRLRVGQKIQVMGSTPLNAKTKEAPKPAPVAAKKPETYKVQPGDTFYKVARDHALTVNKLQSLNPGVNPSHIMVGQTLGVAGEPRKAIASTSRSNLISTKQPIKKSAPKPAAKSAPKPAAKSAPKKAPTPPLPTKKEEPKPTTFSSIIVMDQISFSDFAKKHDTTPEKLNALNGLNLKPSTLLAKGSELYVSGR